MARKTQQSRTGSVGKPYQRQDGTWGVIIRWFDAQGRRESEAVTIKGPHDRLTAQRRLDTHLRRAEEERVGLRHPVNPCCRGGLRRTEKLKPPEYLLFVGRQGSGRRAGDPMRHRISRPEKALRRSLKKAGIGRKITPHDLRHTFATICVMHGVPLSTLQAWLGHSTLRMTERYVHALRSNDDQWIDKLRFGKPDPGPSVA